MLLDAPIKHRQSISITPLIDVVFILLLFFMLSSTFNRAKQLEITTAAASTGSSQQQDSQIQKILLTSEQTVSVNGVRYTLASQAFTDLLSGFARDNNKVTLAALQSVKVQALIQLIDQTNQAGIRNLDLGESVAAVRNTGGNP